MYIEEKRLAVPTVNSARPLQKSPREKSWLMHFSRITSRSIIATVLLLSLSLVGCQAVQTARLIRAYDTTLASSDQTDTTVTRITAKRDRQGRPARLLSAFYGLDDALPRPSNRVICDGAGGNDGMPVIFSHEIDVKTMQAGDFKVTTASSKTGRITCVTLAPADDSGELRTVPFAGHYGSIEDQPVRVDVVGNVLSIDGKLNFKGSSIKVIPLEVGPTMILAQNVPRGELYLGRAATPLPWGGGSGCPVGTKTIVRVVWVGGVTKPGGDPADEKEGARYKVTLTQANGKTIQVAPFALGDVGDGDNNHKLCLDVVGTPRSVSFPAGFLTDPREDLNPDTTIRVSR